jgi:hypothetical protein
MAAWGTHVEGPNFRRLAAINALTDAELEYAKCGATAETDSR